MDSDKLQNINEKQMIQFQELGIFEHASPIQHYRDAKLLGGGGCYIYNYNFCNYA